MTSIKPPSKPSVGGVDSLGPQSGVTPKSTTGPSFGERVGESAGAQKTAAPAAAQGAQSTQAIVGELRSGAITPNEAVQRLTDAAMQRNRVPPSMRPAVESQVREFLQGDPVVGELLRTMGASLQSMEK